MDCLDYAIQQINEEKIDYLWCNYTKDEISECAKRFGRLNLKNGW